MSPSTEDISVKESADAVAMCPAKKPFLYARTHTGDENGMTAYKCAYAYWADGANAKVTEITFSSSMKESSHSFTCGSNEVMVGRIHDGDENGKTWYACARVAA